MFFLVQAATVAILFTGGNTSFSGFPFLTSFVAEDSFLPRWLSKRGQRLVFSNGIIVLTVLSVALLIAVVGANMNDARAVLRDRRVHRLLHGRVRHGRNTTARTGSRAGGTGWSSTLVRRMLHRARRSDLRDREVHRGRLAGPDRFPDRGIRVHPAEPAVPRARREPWRASATAARPAWARASRTTAGGWSSSSWTTSTCLPSRRCGTPGACGPRPCVRCTSSSTPSRRSSSAQAWLPDKSVSLEFIDCPGPQAHPLPPPNWSRTRRPRPAPR